MFKWELKANAELTFQINFCKKKLLEKRVSFLLYLKSRLSHKIKSWEYKNVSGMNTFTRQYIWTVHNSDLLLKES